MLAIRLLPYFSVILVVASFAILDSDQIANFLPEDENYGSGLLSNPSDDTLSFAAGDDSNFLSDNEPLFSSSPESSTFIAQGGPATGGSTMKFDDANPDDVPECAFPKHRRCCPNGIPCKLFDRRDPDCQNKAVVYCCENVPGYGDEGDHLGTNLECDQEATFPDWWVDFFNKQVLDPALDFLRTPASDVIPSIPGLLGGDSAWGSPR